MRAESVHLTPEGRQALEAELGDLRLVRRPALIERIHDGQANAGADDAGAHEEAKDELAQIDNRVREIENILRHAQVIRSNGHAAGVVGLGSQVTVRDEGGDTLEWRIVSSAEANMRAGKISSDSLVGAAMMGRKAGDTVAVRVPAGEMTYTIVQVQ